MIIFVYNWCKRLEYMVQGLSSSVSVSDILKRFISIIHTIVKVVHWLIVIRRLFTSKHIWINPINPFEVTQDKPIKLPQLADWPIQISIHTHWLLFSIKHQRANAIVGFVLVVSLDSDKKWIANRQSESKNRGISFYSNVIPNCTKGLRLINTVHDMFNKKRFRTRSNLTRWPKGVKTNSAPKEICLSHLPVC